MPDVFLMHFGARCGHKQMIGGITLRRKEKTNEWIARQGISKEHKDKDAEGTAGGAPWESFWASKNVYLGYLKGRCPEGHAVGIFR